MSALRELRERVARQFPGEIWVQRHPSGTECFIYSERAGAPSSTHSSRRKGMQLVNMRSEETDNADQ